MCLDSKTGSLCWTAFQNPKAALKQLNHYRSNLSIYVVSCTIGTLHDSDEFEGTNQEGTHTRFVTLLLSVSFNRECWFPGKYRPYMIWSAVAFRFSWLLHEQAPLSSVVYADGYLIKSCKSAAFLISRQTIAKPSTPANTRLQVCIHLARMACIDVDW